MIEAPANNLRSKTNGHCGLRNDPHRPMLSIHNEHELGNFKLGKLALVCRWRLAGKRLPLAHRHVRALAKRRVHDALLSSELLAWVRQHLEWTLTRGAARHPDGVLMLMVDEDKHAAMTVGAYEPLPTTLVRHLLLRAQQAQIEAVNTGVAPEVLWLAQDDHLVCATPNEQVLSGANDLVFQLATTIGIPVMRKVSALTSFEREQARTSETFLVSDEYGVVVASDMKGSKGIKLAKSYVTLLDKERKSIDKERNTIPR